jgi:hypothetical protein
VDGRKLAIVGCPWPVSRGLAWAGREGDGEGREGAGAADVRILGVQVEAITQIVLPLLDETQLPLQVVALVVTIHGA